MAHPQQAPQTQHFTYIRNQDGHFVCPECGIVKIRQNSMHYHMKKHQNDRNHICTWCNKGFLQKQTLDLHVRSRHPEHATRTTAPTDSDTTSSSDDGEKPYHCPFDQCEFKALTKGNCVIHCLRVHFQEEMKTMMTLAATDKTITCNHCHRVFRSTSSFYYHCKGCHVPIERNNEKYRRLQTVLH